MKHTHKHTHIVYVRRAHTYWRWRIHNTVSWNNQREPAISNIIHVDSRLRVRTSNLIKCYYSTILCGRHQLIPLPKIIWKLIFHFPNEQKFAKLRKNIISKQLVNVSANIALATEWSAIYFWCDMLLHLIIEFCVRRNWSTNVNRFSAYVFVCSLIFSLPLAIYDENISWRKIENSFRRYLTLDNWKTKKKPAKKINSQYLAEFWCFSIISCYEMTPFSLYDLPSLTFWEIHILRLTLCVCWVCNVLLYALILCSLAQQFFV